MEESRPIRIRIITPEKIIYNEMINHVVIPAIDGEVGIFHHHAPFMSLLRAGRIQIHLHDGSVTHLDIKSGFFEFKDNTVTILTKDDVTRGQIKAAVDISNDATLL